MKKIFITFSMALLVLSSCATTNYGKSVEENSVVLSGRVIKSDKRVKAEANDILFEGEGTNWKNKNAVEVSVPFVFGSRIYPTDHTHEFQWKGTASVGDFAQEVLLTYTWENDTNGHVSEISNVCIFVPDSATYKFMPFTLEKEDMFLTNLISSDDMPYDMTQVMIDGKAYVLQAQCKNLGDIPQCALLTMKNQVFRIVDEDGNVCAEFDDSSYKIFETENITPEKILPCVAAYSMLYATRVQDKEYYWNVELSYLI